MSEFQELLEHIEEAFGVRICVHDVSGITYTVHSLELPYLWKTHGCDYCTAAKGATSERECMRQKEIALYLLKKNGVRPYCGICRMGVYDAIEPVKIDGHLMAVVFASGVPSQCREKCRERLLACLQKKKIERPALLEQFEAFADRCAVTEEQVRFFARLVKRLIIREARGSPHRILPSTDNYPVESVRTWRTGISAILVTYLEENYRKKMTLKMLSQRFLLSEGHINRLVRSEVNMGAMAYVKHLRLEAAAAALVSSGGHIFEIGESVGYSEPNYFCRLFKATYGMTPTEYREKYSTMYKQSEDVPNVL